MGAIPISTALKYSVRFRKESITNFIHSRKYLSYKRLDTLFDDEKFPRIHLNMLQHFILKKLCFLKFHEMHGELFFTPLAVIIFFSIICNFCILFLLGFLTYPSQRFYIVGYCMNPQGLI